MIEFKYIQHSQINPENIERTIILSIDDDSGLHDTMQAFRSFLLAVGYHPESIDGYIEAE